MVRISFVRPKNGDDGDADDEKIVRIGKNRAAGNEERPSLQRGEMEGPGSDERLLKVDPAKAASSKPDPATLEEEESSRSGQSRATRLFSHAPIVVEPDPEDQPAPSDGGPDDAGEETIGVREDASSFEKTASEEEGDQTAPTPAGFGEPKLVGALSLDSDPEKVDALWREVKRKAAHFEGREKEEVPAVRRSLARIGQQFKSPSADESDGAVGEAEDQDGSQDERSIEIGARSDFRSDSALAADDMASGASEFQEEDKADRVLDRASDETDPVQDEAVEPDAALSALLPEEEREAAGFEPDAIVFDDRRENLVEEQAVSALDVEALDQAEQADQASRDNAAQRDDNEETSSVSGNDDAAPVDQSDGAASTADRRIGFSTPPRRSTGLGRRAAASIESDEALAAALSKTRELLAEEATFLSDQELISIRANKRGVIAEDEEAPSEKERESALADVASHLGGSEKDETEDLLEESIRAVQAAASEDDEDLAGARASVADAVVDVEDAIVLDAVDATAGEVDERSSAEDELSPTDVVIDAGAISSDLSSDNAAETGEADDDQVDVAEGRQTSAEAVATMVDDAEIDDDQAHGGLTEEAHDPLSSPAVVRVAETVEQEVMPSGQVRIAARIDDIDATEAEDELDGREEHYRGDDESVDAGAGGLVEADATAFAEAAAAPPAVSTHHLIVSDPDAETFPVFAWSAEPTVANDEIEAADAPVAVVTPAENSESADISGQVEPAADETPDDATARIGAGSDAHDETSSDVATPVAIGAVADIAVEQTPKDDDHELEEGAAKDAAAESAAAVVTATAQAGATSAAEVGQTVEALDHNSVQDQPERVSSEKARSVSASSAVSADPSDALDLAEQTRMVEAMLFASEKPLSTAELGARMPAGSDPAVAVRRLEEMYAARGVRVVRVAGKWAFRTAPDLAYLMSTESVESRKLSKAAIETLAIVAYHQPVTRADIEEIRQVSVSKGTIDLLMELEWIKLGRRRQSPGRPVTFITTEKFLDHFGLESTKDLPGLDELRQAGLLDNRPPIGPTPADREESDADMSIEDDEDDDKSKDDQELLM